MTTVGPKDDTAEDSLDSLHDYFNYWITEIFLSEQMAQPILKPRIFAQPQSSYRERYLSELDPRRNRAQRFIRAERNPYNFDYPTIEISKEWNNGRRYIRVTLVTVASEQIPLICVHPYPIDTPELNVIRDPERNTIYFPILDEDLSAGHKSFRIIRKKLIQYELRNYGQLRLLNRDEKDIQRINDPTDARKLIDLYQLGKSQLVFSLAELVYENQLPVIYDAISVFSNIMNAISSTSSTTTDDDLSIKCVPKKGSWQGNDEIFMVIPKIDRRKLCKVIFNHPSMNQIDDIQVDFVDTKTIAFLTPPCPIQAIGNQRMYVPIVVLQGNEEIARVNFLYQSFAECFVCNAHLMFDSFDEPNTNEQTTTMDTNFDETDIFIHNLDQNIKTENGLS